MWQVTLLIFCYSVAVSKCQLDQTTLDYMGRSLDFQFQVEDNLQDGGRTCRLHINLTNTGNRAIETGPWSIFFTEYQGIPDSQLGDGLREQGVRMERVQGSLYRLSPTREFFPIFPRTSRIIRFIGNYWVAMRAAVMPNAYVTAPGLVPRVLENTQDESLAFAGNYNTVRQWKTSPDDTHNPPTPQERFRKHQLPDLKGTEEWRQRIIPSPLRSQVDTNRNVSITNQWVIVAPDDLIFESTFLAGQIGLNRISLTDRRRNMINLTIGVIRPTQVVPDTRILNNNDTYQLTIDPNSDTIAIRGRGPSGVYYGIQTLLMLLNGNTSVPATRILDAPRFEYRGMHLDVSRNFYRKEDVMRILGAMSVYKMNKFQFHLSDDEGWRLEIPGLPELTQLGARRCHDLNEDTCLLPQMGSGPDTRTSGTGFYTIADYREILQFARDRHIEVIPEFVMPQHSRATIRSMESRRRNLRRQGRTIQSRSFVLADDQTTRTLTQEEQINNRVINPCISSTYRFIEHIVDQLIAMHRDIQPLRVYHFGGNEVPEGAFNTSVSCQRLRNTDPVANVSLLEYFVNRVARIASERNLQLAAWEDGLIQNGSVHNRSQLPNTDVFAFPWQTSWETAQLNNSHRLANAGYKVIMSQSTHLSFDHPHEADPEERGVPRATRFIDSRKVFGFSPLNLYSTIDFDWHGEPLTRLEVCGVGGHRCEDLRRPENIIGIQGQLWTQLVRTRDQLDSLLYPRLLALSERAWHEAPWEILEQGPERLLQEDRDWDSFIRAVAHREIRRMDIAGLLYRIPPPGARMEGRWLQVNTEYPGLPVQYRPRDNNTWRDVTPDLQLTGNQTISLRSRSNDNRRFSRVISFTTMPELRMPILVQRHVDYIAENLQVNITIIENTNNSSRFDLHLQNTGNRSIQGSNWEIHFPSFGPLFPSSMDQHGGGFVLPDHNLRFRHFTGTQFMMQPVPGFRAILPNETRTLRIDAGYVIAARCFILPNWYVTAEGMTARVINATQGNVTDFVAAFTNERQWKRGPGDRYNPPTADDRYRLNEGTRDLGGPGSAILPTPVDMQVVETESVLLTECCWSVVADVRFNREAGFLVETLNMSTVRRTQARPDTRYIEIRFGNPDVRSGNQINSSPGAYRLTVDPQRGVIEITTRDAAGAFYGVQSLLSLCRGRNGTHTGRVPRATVRDAPRYQHRGLLMDVARNFRSKEQVMKVLNIMAAYKMNRFHFRLGDDEGWRLDIPGLPELTRVGSQRCHDVNEDFCLMPQLGSGPDNSTRGSGFYTVQDYREILRYAADRHIEVVEEYGLPGHARAAVVAMGARQRRLRDIGDPSARNFLLRDRTDRPQQATSQMFRDNRVNPCLESTYRFLLHVLQEVQRMRRDISSTHTVVLSVPSEEFANSSACRVRRLNGDAVRQLFTERVSRIASDLGINLTGWSGSLMDLNGNPIPRRSNFDRALAWAPVGMMPQFGWAYRLANAGYQVVMTTASHMFLGHAQEADPEESGPFWSTRYTDSRKVLAFTPSDLYSTIDVDHMGQPLSREDVCSTETTCPHLSSPGNIIGIQASIFAEMTRTAEQQDYMLFPRLLAVAERAWSRVSWENITNAQDRTRARDQEWIRFANSLGYKELPFLDQQGVAYRVSPPGARSEGWRWLVNAESPALGTEVSVDGGVTWEEVNRGYVSAPRSGIPLFRARSAIGQRHSRVVSSSSHPSISFFLLMLAVTSFIFHSL